MKNYTNKDTLEKKIEAVLFSYGNPIEITKLAKAIGVSVKNLAAALDSLAERLNKSSGLVIIKHNKKVQLVSAKEFTPLIEDLFKRERKEKLTKAALEVLAVIAYQGPISRARIEQIRGVGSSYIIRSLLLRGLIEKHERSVSGTAEYIITIDCLRELGLEKEEDLPQWKAIKQDINKTFSLLDGIQP